MTGPLDARDPDSIRTAEDLAQFRRGAQDATEDVVAGVTTFRDADATTTEPGFYWRGYYHQLDLLLREDA